MDFNFNLENVKWSNGWRGLATAIYRLPSGNFKIKTPSVTTIINDMIPDPGIEEWIKEVGKEVADKITKAANDRGTSMHLFIEQFLKKYKESKDPSMALRFTQEQSLKLLEAEGIPQKGINKGRDLFYNFYGSDIASTVLDTLGIEIAVYSPYLFYRGIVDVMYNRSGVAISDFKTSNKPIEKGSVKEKKYKTQLGGYALAFEHMYKKVGKNINVNYASIINMHTKSNLVYITECTGNELTTYKNLFRNFCILWHKNNNQEFLFKNDTSLEFNRI